MTIGGVTGGDCPAGQVVQSIDANGQANCVEDMHVKGTACPVGQVVTGYDANGVPQCKVDQDTRTVGSCSAGQVVNAILADGTVTCVADQDMHVKGTSCPTGNVLTGYDAQGTPQCIPIPGVDSEFPCASGTPVGDRWVVSFSGRSVCDRNTNKTWEQRPTSVVRRNNDSRNYCPTLGAGWELPEIDVLQTLVDTTSSMCNPGQEGSLCLSDDHPFDNVVSDLYWSATSLSSDPLFRRLVDFSTGALNSFGFNTVLLRTWCVR